MNHKLWQNFSVLTFRKVCAQVSHSGSLCGRFPVQKTARNGKTVMLYRNTSKTYFKYLKKHQHLLQHSQLRAQRPCRHNRFLGALVKYPLGNASPEDRVMSSRRWRGDRQRSRWIIFNAKHCGTCCGGAGSKRSIFRGGRVETSFTPLDQHLECLTECQITRTRCIVPRQHERCGNFVVMCKH